MTPEQKELVQKAANSLKAANILLAEGFPGFAVSRVYYSMFYIATAFLVGEGLSYSKHSGTISGFGQHFIKTGKIPKHFHRYLIHAFEARQDGDYAPEEVISTQAAYKIIHHAHEFVDLANEKIK